MKYYWTIIVVISWGTVVRFIWLNICKILSMMLGKLCCSVLSFMSNSATPWTAAHHTFLSFTTSKGLLRIMYIDLPGGASGKESACNTGDVRDTGSIPGSIRSTGGGHGNPLQHSYLENPIDVGIWWATVHRVTKSQTQLMWLSTHTCPLSQWCYQTISSSATPFSSCPQSLLLLDLHSKINH